MKLAKHMHLLFLAATSAVLTPGCAVRRDVYYSDVRHERSLRYEAWRHQIGGDPERPVLHGPLALAEAVRLTLQYNPRLHAALQQRDEASGRILEAYSAVLPRLDAGASYTRLDQVTTVDLGVETFEIGDLNNYSYRVEIRQPIFRAGAPMAIRGARLYSYLTDEIIRGVVERVVSEVALAYYDAVLAERLIAVQGDALRAAEAHLSNVESRLANGMATEYDVLRAKVDVSNTTADLIEQQNRMTTATTRLMKAIGTAQRSDVRLLTELSYDPVTTTYDEAVRTAFHNRSDIYQAILAVDLQREAVNELQTRYLPTVDAYWWHLWSRPDPHRASNINWGTQWQAGIGLTWGLFDGLAREGQIVQGKARLRQRALELTDVEEQVLFEIRAALDDLSNARELVESQDLNLERAQRALELVQAGYREGVNSEVEILDARAALTRASGLHYQALYRHTAARIRLRLAMGMLAAPPGSREAPAGFEHVPGMDGGAADPRSDGGNHR